MTSLEARDAMLKRLPVVSGGITYSRISAIIYRPADNGDVKVSVELLDKNEHSVTITYPKDVTLRDNTN